MILEGFPVGPIQANCYIVGDETSKKGVVIDPGDEAERILNRIKEHDLTIEVIFNTHGHFDHVGANKRLKEATGAKIAIHPEDAHYLGKISQSAAVWGMHAEDSPPPDLLLEEGQIIGGRVEIRGSPYTGAFSRKCFPGNAGSGACFYRRSHLRGVHRADGFSRRRLQYLDPVCSPEDLYPG